jgi:hypothetical protein
MFLKNTAGEKSASLTMMIIGFIVVTLWLLVSIVSKIGHLEIRPFSSSEAMSFLVPLMTLYFGRRFTDGKNQAESDTVPADTTSTVDPSAKK